MVFSWAMILLMLVIITFQILGLRIELRRGNKVAIMQHWQIMLLAFIIIIDKVQELITK